MLLCTQEAECQLVFSASTFVVVVGGGGVFYAISTFHMEKRFSAMRKSRAMMRFAFILHRNQI